MDWRVKPGIGGAQASQLNGSNSKSESGPKAYESHQERTGEQRLFHAVRRNAA